MKFKVKLLQTVCNKQGTLLDVIEEERTVLSESREEAINSVKASFNGDHAFTNNKLVSVNAKEIE